MSELYLGVDGGGTKTALALVDRAGAVLAESRADSSYYFTTGIDAVALTIKEAVREVCGRLDATPGDVTYAFFGLPGYGESSTEQPQLDALGATVLGHDRYRCGNDMICGWAGSLGAVDGINMVSGTGSICYGERAGRGVRVGGWGEVFSDEGSAYWIGARGLNLVSQMSDGRRPAGALLDLIRNRFELPTDLDLVDLVLTRWQGDRGRIAAVSALVDEAARDGDPAAADLLHSAGAELADIVETTRRRLDWPAGEQVPVSYSGGTFASELVRDSFTGGLDAARADYDLREPLRSPHVGAALYAARLHAATPVGSDTAGGS